MKNFGLKSVLPAMMITMVVFAGVIKAEEE
jgi:hypothetical protein